MKTSVNMFQFDYIMRFKDLVTKSSFSGLPKYHLDKQIVYPTLAEEGRFREKDLRA